MNSNGRKHIKEVRRHFKRVCQNLDANPTEVEIRLLQGWTDYIQEILTWSAILGENTIKKKGWQLMPPRKRPKAKTKSVSKKEADLAQETTELGSAGNALSNIDFSSLGNLQLGSVSATVTAEEVASNLQVAEASASASGSDDDAFKASVSSMLLKLETQLEIIHTEVADIQKKQFELIRMVQDVDTNVGSKVQSAIAQLAEKVDLLRAAQPVKVVEEGLVEKEAPAAKAKPAAKKKASKKRKAKDRKNTPDPRPNIPVDAAQKIINFVKSSVTGEVNAEEFSNLLGKKMGISPDEVLKLLSAENMVEGNGLLVV